MKNQEVAKILYDIAIFLAIDDVAFKPYAYEKAALNIESLEEDLEDIYKKGGKGALEDIPGVGKNIADSMEEYLKTGKIKYYESLKKKLPVELDELMAIEGVGPKKIKVLYQKLGIKNLKELERAAKGHKIASLFSFGEKSEKNILEGIAFLKRSKGRFLLGEIFPKAKEIEEKLKALKEIKKISQAGSLRRKKETIGDVDFLVVTKNPKKVMDFFVSLPGVDKVWAKGLTKASVKMSGGFDVDLRAVPEKSYGSALQYFTGSKEHNIATRKIAINKGLKLNEYGVFKGKKMVAGWSEEGIYRALGMLFIEPELRENRGEVEASLEGKLPKLIELGDIKGDLHCHSDWDGGENSILEMARTAIEKGYEYLGISDHTKFLRIEQGLDEKQLEKQRKEIEKLNRKLKKENLKFKILQGAETNILNDGSLDIKDKALSKLDYVIAGVHSSLKMPRAKMTERIIRAMKNPFVKIISHPTGRILKKRDEYQADFDKILRAAKEFGVALEVNACPERMDLNDINIKKAMEAGVKLAINTDSHRKDQLKFMEFGIFQARRGWAKKQDIINTQSLENLFTL
ncbi:MAG: DNA polymerase/3'-5' exonuclease PolX [Candidatus Nealsonbacteria bacterium]|nr:DNA polymerase/3'-5' exonuclease PolX [Candidatus Nealsonbacteria bacterium]